MLIFLICISFVHSVFIPAVNIIVNHELSHYNKLLIENDIPCHIQSARVKTFRSAILKSSRDKTQDIYNLHDLIAFRFVFYNKEDMFKFYHHNKIQKNILYSYSYFVQPKENNYKAIHFRYQSIYENVPIKHLECQMFVLNDYYNSLYGSATYNKTYEQYCI